MGISVSEIRRWRFHALAAKNPCFYQCKLREDRQLARDGKLCGCRLEDEAMLKSEAEQMIRRTLEETGAEMSDEEISLMAQVILKICGRMIEEALSTFRPGSKASFFD